MYTKEQLEKLSDGLGENYRFCVSEFNSLAKCLIGTDGCGSVTTSFDVNDWADMGPLIHSSGITVNGSGGAHFDKIVTIKTGSITFDGINTLDSRRECEAVELGPSSGDKNCLRAAATVYLLMQD